MRRSLSPQPGCSPLASDSTPSPSLHRVMFREFLNNSEQSQIEQLRLLRQFELQAYTGVINAFSAQGELTERKRKLLKELQSSLSISIERHKAEIRRALNDEVIESVSNANGETRSEWIIEGKRSVPVRRRAIPETHATLLANSKSRHALERPDLLRPKYKFFSKKSAPKVVETVDSSADADGGSAIIENGGDDVSTVDDDTASGTCNDGQISNVPCKADDQNSNVFESHKPDNVKEKVCVVNQEIPEIQAISEARTSTTTTAVFKDDNTHEEFHDISSSRQQNISNIPEPKPVISTVQSLYNKSSSIVFKPNVDHLSQSTSCVPNIKQVASTVTIGTSETSDAPTSTVPTPVSLQQSNIKLLNRQTNIIVVHRPSKLSPSSRIAIPQPSNNRSIRVIRQDVPPSSGQQIHATTPTDSRVALNVNNTVTHNYPGIVNVDLDSDTPPLPQMPPPTPVKQKTYLPPHSQQQTQQSIQIQQAPTGEVYHVSQASNDPRIITPHSAVATYQKPEPVNYPSMEVRKLELQPVLRDQLQHATQKPQGQHQQQLLVLQAHMPQAQHQDQKPLQTRLIYTQPQSHTIQRNSSPPPVSSQPQQLQIQLQMQRQQQHSTQPQQISQSSHKQTLPQQASIAHLTQQASSQHQQQLIQGQPQIQLATNQPQIRLQQPQTPQIQLQQPQPIMLTQSLKPQQYQLPPSQQQNVVSIDDQNSMKHQLKQESHQQQVLLLKGQLLQIQPIGGEQAAKARPVASLINESSLSPGKRLKPETTNKRKITESFGDWQAEVLPLISKLLDSCLLESTNTGVKSQITEGLVKQDLTSDNQEKLTLMRMKENLVSRQYLNQQSFENDMQQLQASCLKKYAINDKKRVEMEDLFATFYRDLRILKQSSAETHLLSGLVTELMKSDGKPVELRVTKTGETSAEPPSKMKIYESG